MNTTALLLSAALALVASVQDAQPDPAQPDPALSEPPAAPALDDAPATMEAETANADLITPQAGAERAQAWLTGLDTLSARFEQLGADATQTAGTLHLARPGRARFDYDDPNPVLVVADGTTVAIADFDLETIDRAPIGATPLRFLLEDTLDLTEAVVDAGRYDGRLYVTLVDPAGETDGRLTLVFEDANPDAAAETMRFAGWYAIDALGGLTEVRLSEVQTGQRLNPRLFILDDEDVLGGDDRRRRGR